MLLKKILIVACLFITIKASAQINIINRGDTIILANGAKFWLGEQVTLTSGSNPDKSFSFIYLPEVLHLIKKKSLPPDYAGKQATVRKFQKDGVYKGTYAYNILVLDLATVTQGSIGVMFRARWTIMKLLILFLVPRVMIRMPS